MRTGFAEGCPNHLHNFATHLYDDVRALNTDGDTGYPDKVDEKIQDSSLSDRKHSQTGESADTR